MGLFRDLGLEQVQFHDQVVQLKLDIEQQVILPLNNSHHREAMGVLGKRLVCYLLTPGKQFTDLFLSGFTNCISSQIHKMPVPSEQTTYQNCVVKFSPK